jgi:hypothetical protein
LHSSFNAFPAAAAAPGAPILARPALFRENIQLLHGRVDGLRKALAVLEGEHLADCQNLYSITSVGEVALQASDACDSVETLLNIEEVSGVTRRSSSARKMYLTYFKTNADILKVLADQTSNLISAEAILPSLRRLAVELGTAMRRAEQLMRGNLGTD